MSSRLSWLFSVAVSVLLLAPAARADEIRFPLAVDHDLLQMALRQHLQRDAGGRLELWRSADGCGSFALTDVTIESADGRIRLRGPATGGAGISVFGLCWANVTWSGHADITARPEIGADWQLRLRDLSADLLDRSGQRRSIAARLFTVVKSWSEAQLATFTYDLGPPISELSALLRTFAGPGESVRLEAAFQSMRPVAVTVEPGGVAVTVALDVPPGPAPPRAPEAALTSEELKRWEARLDDWDAFLAFVVKDLASDNADAAARDELLHVLLDAREEILVILARGPERGTDAVRRLFASTWTRLRPVVRHTATQPSGDVGRGFRYVVFLAAGDALAALDAAAPGAGLDFSADGLRRLARTLEPHFAGDPLARPEDLDPHLQQLFRFRDPDAPPRRPRRKPPRNTWDWFMPRPAHAADGDEWRTLAVRLDRWVPGPGELETYRATVDRLLSVAAERSIDSDRLDERFDELFHHLVKATAWQESCWRQFVRGPDRVIYLESGSGDVGLMQINARVWRGFFSVTKLQWNAAYNAGAGAEILQQLLIRYGTREASTQLENAARASYSAYHGGPARYRRYRTATPASLGGMIDRAFWEKYQAVASGVAGDRVLCLRPRPVS